MENDIIMTTLFVNRWNPVAGLSVATGTCIPTPVDISRLSRVTGPIVEVLDIVISIILIRTGSYICRLISKMKQFYIITIIASCRAEIHK